MTKSIKRPRALYITGGILLLLIIIRLMLPSIVLRYANTQLSEMKGYYGHVKDIDIALYRGAYQLDSIYINKVDSVTGKQIEFFSARTIDLSVEWSALFDGRIVGELVFLSPKLIFTKDKAEIGQVAKDTNDFRKILKDFMPLKVNRFEIQKGSIHYVDNTKSPKVDIFLENTYVLAQNLKNTSDSNTLLPSPIQASADVYDGKFTLDMKVNALEKQPTFDLTAELKSTKLVKVNDFFKAYGKFDVSKGSMGLYTEFAAKDGKFKGYVKPIIKDLQVLGTEDKKDNLGQKIKEGAIEVAGKILKNPKKEQVATKVPIEGSFSNTSVDTPEAIWEILRNAFIEALMPSVDNEINIQSAETVDGEEDKPGFFKRLFTSKKKREEQAKEKNREKPVEKQTNGLKKYSSVNQNK
ncbi:DUF748 domain-containing protein [Niabella aquatica]